MLRMLVGYYAHPSGDRGHRQCLGAKLCNACILGSVPSYRQPSRNEIPGYVDEGRIIEETLLAVEVASMLTILMEERSMETSFMCL